MQKKTIILTIVFFVTFLNAVIAQELTIKSMSAAPMDLSASQYERKDLAGQPCGLVKVQLATMGAKFEGNIVGQTEYKTGEYWVYMEDGAYRLTVKHPNFVPLNVNFRDYNINGITAKSTYILTLLMPNNRTTDSGFAIETFTVNGVSFNMVRVEGGTFIMGATPEQGKDAEYYEKPIHRVTLSTYSIGETEVTQDLWEAVMGSNPSAFKGSKRPVEKVSWDECQAFVQELSRLTRRRFRLPTEAEWEYAARGGNLSQGYKYSGSNDIDEVAWYTKTTSNKGTKEVKTKKANELGLYDMSGNVWEWCQDWYGSYSRNQQKNPKGPSKGFVHVGRGGGWWFNENNCRVSYRDNTTPAYRSSILGMRLAL